MKLVLISDTHQRHRCIPMPKGDVLVHAGDFCSRGKYGEVESFANWLSTLDYEHVLFIAGNHDKTFEFNRQRSLSMIPEETMFGGKIHYLQDSEVILDGVKFYGSPWQPRFYDWAFNLERDGDEIKNKWEKIPDDTDVLITHSPPHGILDGNRFGTENIGCKHLFERVLDVKPTLHVFGHCHAGYGMNYHLLDGTVFVNAAVVGEFHNVQHEPVEFEEDFNGLRRDKSCTKKTSGAAEGRGQEGSKSPG